MKQQRSLDCTKYLKNDRKGHENKQEKQAHRIILAQSLCHSLDFEIPVTRRKI
jgi:hypothetical protein